MRYQTGPQASDEQVGGSHYLDLAVEPTIFNELNRLSHTEGEVVARLTRWRREGGKGVEDIDKAIHSLRYLREIAREHWGYEEPA